MNPKELILQVERAIQFGRMDDWKVVIPVRRIGSIGGTPCVNIESVSAGFDWDSGKVFLSTKESLREIDRDEIKAIRDKYEELGWSQYKIGKIKKENEMLKKRIEELEKMLDQLGGDE
jgi:hypothetical protein